MRTKLAVVIGAGTIGSAIAAHLVRRGYRCVTAGHDQVELADTGDIERFFESIEHVDVLVNAAGTYGAIGKVRDVPPAAWRSALDVNLVGVYACCHHAMRRMPAGGHIINLAGAGQGAMPMRSAYASSKSALVRFTETLAAEEPALRVNAIAPGPMDSRMQDAIATLAHPWAEFVRQMRKSGRGAVPVECTLRVIDHILESAPTGKLFFARQFKPAPLRLEASALAG